MIFYFSDYYDNEIFILYFFYDVFYLKPIMNFEWILFANDQMLNWIY